MRNVGYLNGAFSHRQVNDDMSRTSMRFPALAGTVVVAVAIVLVPLAGASALGSNSFWCGSAGNYYGGSWNTPNTSDGGAQTAWIRRCGTMGAQAMYRPYPGGPQLYSNWVYHPSNAIKNQSGTVGGKHWNSNTGTVGTT